MKICYSKWRRIPCKGLSTVNQKLIPQFNLADLKVIQLSKLIIYLKDFIYKFKFFLLKSIFNEIWVNDISS